METFPCLRLAFDALEMGKELPTVLNAANEKAVALFLDERIAYVDIAKIIEDAMTVYLKEQFDSAEPLTIHKILETEQWTYEYILERWLT